MSEHVPLPWCRHLGPTCSGPHQTRKCCACGANLGHQAWLAYWDGVIERDEERPYLYALPMESAWI